MAPRTPTAIPVASRIGGFVYAIRNIVTEAKKVEAAGRTVRYLNIGDPITFGFQTPPHLIEAVEAAMRGGQNGYAPSVGIAAAREAVAADCERRGMPVSPDRVVITSGTSEGIELALTALAEAGDEVLVPVPTYPLYTAVLAKIGAKRRLLPDRSRHEAGSPTSITCEASSPRRRGRSSSSTRTTPSGATYSADVRRALVDIADRHSFPLLADEVYADLAFDGPIQALAAEAPGRAGHLVLVALEGLSRARLARRLDGRRPRPAPGRRAGGGQEAGGWPALRHRSDGVRDRRRAEWRPIAPGRPSAPRCASAPS